MDYHLSDYLNITISFYPLKQNVRQAYLVLQRHLPGTGDEDMNTIATSALAPTVAASDVAATAGRLLLAAIFLLSGWSKLGDPAGTAAYIASVGLPLSILGAYVAIAVELIGGAMLVIGYRTRLAASALALFTLITAVFFHFELGDQNQFIHFFKNIAIAGGLLQVMAFGSGRFGLDR